MAITWAQLLKEAKPWFHLLLGKFLGEFILDTPWLRWMDPPWTHLDLPSTGSRRGWRDRRCAWLNIHQVVAYFKGWNNAQTAIAGRPRRIVEDILDGEPTFELQYLVVVAVW